MCAIVGCREQAVEPPVVLALPGTMPIEVPLCGLCREPFEGSVEQLVEAVYADGLRFWPAAAVPV
jgi:hypothetical protein